MTVLTDKPKDEPLKECSPDMEEYYNDLSDLNLTKAQKAEVLQTLWNIMCTFVDMGWGVDTLQIVLPEVFAQVSKDNSALPESLEGDNNES